MQIDHVAFLVGSLDVALESLAELNLAIQARERFEGEGTEECYVGDHGQSARLLLLEPIGDGPYRDALKRRGPGLHHIGVHVPSIDTLLREVDGWYLHPRSFETREECNTVWLTRPGVSTLIEVHEAESRPGSAVVEGVRVTGLTELTAKLFENATVPVEAGFGAAKLGGSWHTFEEPLASPEDVFQYNRGAWNAEVARGNKWTVPVSREEVEVARTGELSLLLTPKRPIGSEWLGDVSGKKVLCLASGGGQQGPLFAAAGADVTVFDASDAQLARDREVAERDGLELTTVQGDMRDLGALEDESFDLIFHPCSNCFVEEILPVWRECYRVLRRGGELLAGFNNPVTYCFDWSTIERGDPKLVYKLPYADVDYPEARTVRNVLRANEPLEYGHTLSDQIGGQLDAGLVLIDMFEDEWGSGYFPDNYFAGFFATRSRKP